MRLVTTLLLTLLIARPCFAWSEGGHHLIAVMAFDLLTEDEKFQLQEILKSHPRFAEDFAVPGNIGNIDETNHFLIGTAGYWPDIARKQPKFHRSSWHYQLGSTLTIGDDVQPPKTPGPVPDDATAETQELHIAQALELNRKIFGDKSRSKAERAIALCWIAHLVGDAHQPCHAGSLYIAGLFPEGDRGANSIQTKQAKNMHALWDQLLGPRFDAGDIRRRALEIKADESTWKDAAASANAEDGLNPLTWLAESAEFGRSNVYTPAVLAAIKTAAKEKKSLETLDMPEDYLKSAGNLARVRAAFAAHRLAGVWRDALK